MDPGSKFFPSYIPDPNIFHPGSATKNLSILTQNIVSKLSKIWSGLFVPDPDILPTPDPGYRGQKGTGSRTRSRIPNPGVKKAPDRGSGSATQPFLLVIIIPCIKIQVASIPDGVPWDGLLPLGGAAEGGAGGLCAHASGRPGTGHGRRPSRPSRPR